MSIKDWNGHKGPCLDSVNGFDIIGCERCGFVHITPLPTADDLDKVYRNEYYTSEKPLYIERYKEDLKWWNNVYSERFDTFESYLDTSRRRIVDIGSGPGFFLLHGKERQWQTIGIEPSAQAAAHSRGLGLEIVEEFLDDQLAANLGLFDVVHMSEVLEHIPEPAGMLLRANRILNPGGLICVVVPNDYNPFQQALRTSCSYKPWWLAPPHHVNYFDPDAIKKLLATCGFEILLQEATFPIDMFLLMGDNYVGNDEVGRSCHKKRMALELNLAAAGLTETKRQLYRAFADNNLGREIMIVGRKCESTL